MNSTVLENWICSIICMHAVCDARRPGVVFSPARSDSTVVACLSLFIIPQHNTRTIVVLERNILITYCTQSQCTLEPCHQFKVPSKPNHAESSSLMNGDTAVQFIAYSCSIHSGKHSCHSYSCSFIAVSIRVTHTVVAS